MTNPASHNPHTLPRDLPVPIDDGACDHLTGMSLPSIELPSTTGATVNLSTIGQPASGWGGVGRAVMFFYPRTGVPGQPPSKGFAGEDWDEIPGARGCTPQSCGYRDRYEDFAKLGVTIYGVSTSVTTHQREFVERNHVPFEMLSDGDLKLVCAMKLPTFRFPVESGGPTTLIKRMAWYIENGRIEKVFYPVFPANENAATVLAWLQRRLAKQGKPASACGGRELTVRRIEERDLTWVREELKRNWGGSQISSIGQWFDAEALPGYIAQIGVDRVGLLTHTVMESGGTCEIVTLSSRVESAGVGTALMQACERDARYAGCSRLMLTTTNDNLRAIGFYQKRGWTLVAVHRGAIDAARKVKPSIPVVGQNNIPLRDEIELERVLGGAST